MNEEIPTLIEELIGASDELLAAVGRLRKIDPDFPTQPLSAVLDKVLDARGVLMKARDARKGKAVAA